VDFFLFTKLNKELAGAATDSSGVQEGMGMTPQGDHQRGVCQCLHMMPERCKKCKNAVNRYFEKS
jgi:hypothetical protein